MRKIQVPLCDFCSCRVLLTLPGYLEALFRGQRVYIHTACLDFWLMAKAEKGAA